ncbi:MAG: GvpL/GvpF family gas vesicle protein [Parvularculaceae bacterium]
MTPEPLEIVGVGAAGALQRLVANGDVASADLVAAGSLAAVVERAGLDPDGPAARARYDRVASIMERTDFLPARLGVRAADACALRSWLVRRGAALRGALADYGASSEFALRFSPPPSDNDRGSRIDSGRAYLNAARERSAARRAFVTAAENVLDRAAAWPGAQGAKMSPATADLGDPVRASILFRRDAALDDFVAALSDWALRDLPSGATASARGPWPPFGAFDFATAT